MLSQWYTIPQTETIDVPSSLAGHWAYPAGNPANPASTDKAMKPKTAVQLWFFLPGFSASFFYITGPMRQGTNSPWPSFSLRVRSPEAARRIFR